jgi:hypothetical protein
MRILWYSLPLFMYFTHFVQRSGVRVSYVNWENYALCWRVRSRYQLIISDASKAVVS